MAEETFKVDTEENTEDKTVKVEFKLHTPNFPLDGASIGYLRMASTAGTIHDMWLNPKNGGVDSILVGTTTFSKHEKNGYWTPVSLSINDPVGNTRCESKAACKCLEKSISISFDCRFRVYVKFRAIYAKVSFGGTICVEL